MDQNTEISDLRMAANTASRGELIAFPTDTYYALGADALNAEAVERVFEAKGRNPGQPVPVLISNLEMGARLVTDFPPLLRELADHFWPGALTIVLPASDEVPEVVTAGTRTVGLRVPDHDLARDLIALAGTPLTGTSCNITGQPPTKSAIDVTAQLGDRLSACINAPCGEATAPSTVATIRDESIALLRVGAISADSIRNVVGNRVLG